MNTKSNKIKCPSCGEPIDVNKVLYHQLEGEVRKDFDAHVKKAVQEKQRILKEEAREEHAEEVKALEKELKEKSNQVKELNKSKAEIGRLKREKDELRGKITSELEQQLSETLAEKETKLRKNYDRQLAQEQAKLQAEKEAVEKQKLKFDAHVKKAVQEK